MRVLVVGCGSIGSRRARLLAEMGHEVSVLDSDPTAMERAATGIAAVLPLDVVSDTYRLDQEPWDAVLVCTPADTHVRIARGLLAEGAVARGLFIEKPLSVSMDGIPELIAECEARGVVTMGACNMRWAYRDARRHDDPQPWTIATVSSPLSSWGGDTDRYRDAGIVLECAIHEMDLCSWINGPITALGDGTIGTDDAVTIRAAHANGLESMVCAWWAEDASSARTLQIGPRIYHPDTSELMYWQEMTHFLDHVSSGTATTNPLANAAETLRWALKARDMTRRVVA